MISHLSSFAALAARATTPDGQPIPDAPLDSPYGYTPAMANCIAFTVVFSLLTIAHLGLAIKFKYWAAIVTMVVGGLLEIIGWAGRLWSAKNPLLWDNFIMQICCLILGPVFFSAWDYTLLGLSIKHIGHQYSLIGPNLYLVIFVIADIVSLVLQAIGGGGAAMDAKEYRDTTTNTHIMLAGILFQLGTTTIFVVLAVDFIVRVVWDKPYSARWLEARNLCRRRSKNTEKSGRGTGDSSASSIVTDTTHPTPKLEDTHGPWLRKNQYLLLGIAWATLMIYIRGIYRSIELAEGWSGKIITTESYFIWLDGFIMVLCMAGLAVTHPGWLLPRNKGWK